MLENFFRTTGFMLISYGTLFTPIVASAEGTNPVAAGAVGFIPAAIITGAVLVSKSKTKNKATKADLYIKDKVDLNDSSDRYVRTDTSKVRVNSNNKK